LRLQDNIKKIKSN